MTTTIAPTIQELCMQNIGKLVKEARTKAGLTQVQLAKKLKMTQGAVMQFEQSGDMKISTLTRIAKALKLEVCELLQCHDKPNTP